VQLGGTAHGTSQDVSKASTLKPYPADIHKTKDHLAALIDRYAAMAKSVRKAIDESDEAGDAGTVDIFTAFSRALDKSLWFLEAHVQEKE
jgi:starvation-inducible DNA-binding protein